MWQPMREPVRPRPATTENKFFPAFAIPYSFKKNLMILAGEDKEIKVYTDT